MPVAAATFDEAPAQTSTEAPAQASTGATVSAPPVVTSAAIESQAAIGLKELVPGVNPIVEYAFNIISCSLRTTNGLYLYPVASSLCMV